MPFKKIVYLALAFILPISIFLFLKFFGKNEFDVPLYYQDKSSEIPAGCDAISVPYQIDDSVVRRNVVKVIVLSSEADKQIIERINTAFKEDSIEIASVDKLSDQEKKCIFLTESVEQFVLVDKLNRIRGYYNVNDRDESDRLILELKILLKKY